MFILRHKGFYLDVEDGVRIRNALKINYPNFKFSVRSYANKIKVIMLAGPARFIVSPGHVVMRDNWYNTYDGLIVGMLDCIFDALECSELAPYDISYIAKLTIGCKKRPYQIIFS